MAKHMGIFRQMRLLSQAVNRITKPEDWEKRPIQTADAITSQHLHAIPMYSQAPEHEQQSYFKTSFINVLAAGLWSYSGRPVITLGHKTAAACATTKISANDALDFVRAPWPCFFVRLPVPLLQIMDREQPIDANFLIVICLPGNLVIDGRSSNESRWWYKLCADKPADALARAVFSDVEIAFHGTGLSIWNYNFSLTDILNQDVEHVRWDVVEYTTADLRADWLTRYLMVNTCLFADSPNSQEREAHTARNTTFVKRASKPDDLGSYMNYDLKADGIQLNLCEAVREYVKTGRMPAHYAKWVQPHWKRVVYGQGRALRRLQYIETYLRKGGNDG